MGNERPILIVDDDMALRQTLVEQLQINREFTAAEAGTMSAAQAMFAKDGARFDAVILDVGLPDGDGF